MIDTAMKMAILIVTFIGLIIITSILLAVPVMALWNWLMPVIFGLGKISFWQALGLNLLSALLFKNTNP